MERVIIVKYVAAWLGMMALAVLNGIARDKLYGPRVGDLAAHQFSTAILLILFGAYFYGLERAWPLWSAAIAWLVGVTWLIMTLLFETVLGRFVAHEPWKKILGDYNILAGRLWILVPAWVLCGPYVVYRLNHMA
ncbi:MAG TPA: hypothetical protein VFE23_21110 [Usitatibacter sp.]|nr:hypothetical protein [Usitatibacter sp.]